MPTFAFLSGALPVVHRASMTTRHAFEPNRKPRRRRSQGRRLMTPREKQEWLENGEQWCDFTMPTTHRGTTGRGKKTHFHLLDRYIRRIDAVMPENMEHLVRSLKYRPNQEQTTRTLKLSLIDEDADDSNLTVDDVEEFLSPIQPEGVVLGWRGPEGFPEIYAYFGTNEECREARQLDGQRLGNWEVKVRFSDDQKWERVLRRQAEGFDTDPETVAENEEDEEEEAVVAGDDIRDEAAPVMEKVSS